MTNPQVADLIAARRVALRLTMRAAARLGGVSPTTWSALESGQASNVSMTTQRAVAAALQWPNDWLETIEEGRSPAPVSQLDDAAELRALVTALSEAQQKMAERLAELGAEVAQLRGRTRQDVAASG